MQSNLQEAYFKRGRIMNAWILILIIKSGNFAAINSISTNSYKTCKEAGERFQAITKDSRYLCIEDGQETD